MAYQFAQTPNLLSLCPPPPLPPSRVASCFQTLRPKPSGFALTPLPSLANPGDSPSKIHPDCGPVSRLLARLPSWFDFPRSKAGGELRNKQPGWKMTPRKWESGSRRIHSGHSQGHCCRSRALLCTSSENCPSKRWAARTFAPSPQLRTSPQA